jgi:hypothetical protein
MIGLLNRKRMWATALAAGLGLSSSAASDDAEAALITFDLRVAGGGKSASVTTSGQAVSLELYAVVQNGDNNHNNDAFQLVHTSLVSSELPTGLMGDLAPVSLNTAGSFLDGSLSQAGTAQNLDADVLDKEVGGTNPSDPAGYVIASTGTSAKFATTGAGSTPTEFLLGTTTWTFTGAGVGPTSLNYALRVKTDGLAQTRQLVKFVTDGSTPFSLQSNDPQIAVGDAVVVSVPEPATLGLLGLGALGFMGRRRSR